MPYVGDSNMNGKRPGFLGEVATEYAATRVAGINPVLAAILKVVRSRQASGNPPQLGSLTLLQKASGLFNPVAPTTTYTAPTPIRTPVVNITDAVKQVTATTTRMTNTVPIVQVATLPNGTAVPVPYAGGGGGGQYPGVTSPSQLPDFGSGGPPSFYPEVGTLPEDGDSNISTAGVGNALAGLTSSKPLLAGIALLAFFMLDGKPKRRRR